MALSPVDFAAYSRATGAPYPESPEEKARMVPEVRAFRVGQLQQGESGGENNLLAGIGIGLGLLGAAGTGLALRGRRIPKMDPSGKGGIKVQTNPSADKVFDLERAATQPLNTKKVAPSNVVTEEQVVTEVPVRQADLPGTATKDSGFREFSQKADDITGRDEVLNLIADEQEQAMRTRMEPPDANDFLSDRVDQLISEVEVGPAGEMLAGPEVAAEARQMMGTEANRQAGFVRRINKEGEKVLDEMLAEPVSLTDTYETFGEPAAQAQNIDAVQSASDQLDSRVEAAIQRDTDSVRTGKQQRLFRDFPVKTSTDLEVVGQQLQNERYSDKLFTAQDLMRTNKRGQVITSGLDPQEALDRVNSAASQARGSQAEQLLLNPNVSTEQVKQLGLLGTTPKFDPGTGYVETNPTFELRTGAAASMGDRSGKIKTDTGFETNLGTEGSAFLKETKANKERTNKASTLLAGVVEELQGGAPQSQRQERVKDELTPIRTVAGEETAGVFIDDDQRLRLVGQGDRRFGKIQSEDMNTQGTRQPGGFEQAATSEISTSITDVPAERRAINQERLFTDEFGRQFVIDSKSVVEGRQPLTGIRGTIKQQRVAGKPGTGVMTFSKEAKSEPLSINRKLAEGLAQSAADTYRNNPSAKKAYLQANNPGALKDTQLLSDAGNALDYKDFVIQSVDMGLKREGVKLDILQPIQTKRGKYYLASTHAFVDDLLKTSKDPEVYGRPLKVGSTGAPVLDYEGRYQGDEKYQSQPLPGKYKETRGTGGVDPMQVSDDYEGNIAYNAPRIETGQSKTPLETKPTPSNVQKAGERMFALLSDHKARTGKALDTTNAFTFAANIGQQEGLDANQVLNAALSRTDRSASLLQATRGQMASVKPPTIRYQPEPPPDSIEDITGSAMTQLLAQANRRRGARRS
tara:strand:- start:2373 stop:5129 length:2757 start_codon:yes stop_codon:yes gene_type:complete